VGDREQLKAHTFAIRYSAVEYAKYLQQCRLAEAWVHDATDRLVRAYRALGYTVRQENDEIIIEAPDDRASVEPPAGGGAGPR
jgi:hypothetical protein